MENKIENETKFNFKKETEKENKIDFGIENEKQCKELDKKESEVKEFLGEQLESKTNNETESETTFDFLNASIDQCKEFGEKIRNGVYYDQNLIKIFKYIREKDDWKEEDAITIIKNLYLIEEHVSDFRTDFRTLYGHNLVRLAASINYEGGPNVRVAYALYKTQVEKDEKSFKESAQEHIVTSICGILDNLSKSEKELSRNFSDNFFKLLKEDERFSQYSYDSDYERYLEKERYGDL